MSEGRKMFGAFVIALALFFFWPAVIGAWQEVSVLRSGVAEREALLTERKEIMENVSAQYAEFSSKVQAEDGKRFSSLVPIRKDSAELISAINSIASTTGISVADMGIAVGGNKEGDKLKTISLSLSMSGSYSSLRSFLLDLEKYVRLLNVQNITVTGDQGQLKFSVQAEAYFLQ